MSLSVIHGKHVSYVVLSDRIKFIFRSQFAPFPLPASVFSVSVNDVDSPLIHLKQPIISANRLEIRNPDARMAFVSALMDNKAKCTRPHYISWFFSQRIPIYLMLLVVYTEPACFPDEYFSFHLCITSD